MEGGNMAVIPLRHALKMTIVVDGDRSVVSGILPFLPVLPTGYAWAIYVSGKTTQKLIKVEKIQGQYELWQETPEPARVVRKHPTLPGELIPGIPGNKKGKR